ncbi:MAG TPA: hypothetical protein VMZ50_11795 [Phycisphaerae bacterium]|nr:hypothetical protein [Phycisphaerae bacterium]
MAVYQGSRYSGVKFTGIVGTDGKVRKFLHGRDPLTLQTAQTPIRTHLLERGEQVDGLASRVVGQSRVWWVIADVSNLFFALGLEPGTPLAIPIKDLQDRGNLI